MHSNVVKFFDYVTANYKIFKLLMRFYTNHPIAFDIPKTLSLLKLQSYLYFF